MTKFYKTYGAKYQEVTIGDAAKRDPLKRASTDAEGNIESLLYFPILVRHSAYENREIRTICGFYRRPIDRNAVLELTGLPPERLNVLTCNKIYLTLEREVVRLGNNGQVLLNPQGGPLMTKIRRRFGLLFSKYATSAEVVIAKLSNLAELTFADNGGEDYTWAIRGVYYKPSVIRTVKEEVPVAEVQGEAPDPLVPVVPRNMRLPPPVGPEI